ncbi:hypothetical protein JCM8097_000148 [Rhodosporidiobolus ruineniae]
MAWHSPHKERTGRGPLIALVAGGVAVLLLTLHYLFSTDSTVLETASARLSSLVSTSFTSSTCGANDELIREYGGTNIKLSRVHEGSGFRVQRFLEKLENGESVKVAVVGGSVSNGHGTDERGNRYQYGAIKQTWHSYVSSWLNETYGPTEFVNGAKAATDSSFFRFCWSERVRLAERAPDLVLIELDVNNINDDESRDSTEIMLRSILQLPNQPAVMFVGSFALTSQTGDGGMTNGGDAHMALSSFYDVPQISIRNPLLPALFHNSSLAQPYFKGDPRHIAAPLHRFLGDMVIAYLQEQRCSALSMKGGEPEGELWPNSTFLGAVPARRLTDAWDSTVVHPSAPPTCSIAGSSFSSAYQDPSWTLWSWKNTKTYVMTAKADQRIEFDVEVPQGGEGVVGVGYLRSNSPSYKLGKLVCRVGEQETELDGYWQREVSLTATTVVASGLSPGPYRLVCSTAAGRQPDWTAFRLASIVSA